MSISELCELYLSEFKGNEMFELNRIKPTQIGERLLREFSAFCDERLTKRAPDARKSAPKKYRQIKKVLRSPRAGNANRWKALAK